MDELAEKAVKGDLTPSMIPLPSVSPTRSRYKIGGGACP